MPFVRFKQFRLLWVILASCGWFWLVLAGFGWFWLVLAGFDWFWLLLGGLLVACFITKEFSLGIYIMTFK